MGDMEGMVAEVRRAMIRVTHSLLSARLMGKFDIFFTLFDSDPITSKEIF